MSPLAMQFEELRPAPMTMCTFVLISYFIVTAGIAYDIINEPPAIGGHPDPVTGETICCVCRRKGPLYSSSPCGGSGRRRALSRCWCRCNQAGHVHAIPPEWTVHHRGLERWLLLHAWRWGAVVLTDRVLPCWNTLYSRLHMLTRVPNAPTPMRTPRRPRPPASMPIVIAHAICLCGVVSRRFACCMHPAHAA